MVQTAIVRPLLGEEGLPHGNSSRPRELVTLTHAAVNQRVGQTVSDNTWLAYPAASPGTTAYTANALNQYTAVGGHPDLRRQRQPHLPATEIVASRMGSVLLDSSGPGIPADVMPHLFNSFITTKARGKGTDLGLRICRRIVVEMHGNVQATNRPQGGARFEITLPAAFSRPSD